MKTWPVHEAKSRFSELVERARDEGPQLISRHGKPRAALISIEDYARLEAGELDFVAYLRSGPKFDDFEIERHRDTGRDIDL